MFVLRFTRRGVERRFLAADKGAPAGGGGVSAIRGVTKAARAAAAQEERPLSEANASIVPGMDDILGNMHGVSEFLPKAEEAEEEEQAEPEPEPETEEGEPEAETEEEEEPEPESEEETEEGEPESEEAAEEEEPEEEEEESSGFKGLKDEAGNKIELPAAAQKALNKRFATLTRQKHEAREKAEAAEAKTAELQTQLAQVQAGPIRLAPDADQPLADVMSIQELQQRITTAQQIEDWALRNPKGVEVVVDDKGTKEFVDETAVANHLANARRTLNAAPLREQYLAMNANAEKLAKSAYPKMFTAGTPENQTFLQVKAAMPWLQRRPDYQLIIADAMAGKVVREAKKNPAVAIIKKPLPKVHGGPAPKQAPKVAAKVVQKRGVVENAIAQAGSKSSVLAFAENLVGV